MIDEELIARGGVMRAVIGSVEGGGRREKNWGG